MSGLTHEEVSTFNSLAANSTAAAIKASAGNIVGWEIFNSSAGVRYVKLYDIAAGSVNPASSTPKIRIGIPAGGRSYLAIPNGIYFGTAISVRAVTGVADTDTNAATANDVVLNVFYK